MKEKTVTKDRIRAFAKYLRDEEREAAAIEKYVRDIRAFGAWIGVRGISKELSAAWKEYLKSKGYGPETINSKLSALNKYLVFSGCGDCRVKYLKIQRKLFRRADRDLTKEEYKWLLGNH